MPVLALASLLRQYQNLAGTSNASPVPVPRHYQYLTSIAVALVPQSAQNIE